MKDMSLFLVKNNLGAKMKKGFRNFCNGDGSTSTLNQHCKKSEHHFGDSSACTAAEIVDTAATTPPRTLEDMILQLELEEEIARKAKLDDYGNDTLIMQGRMSCVNNSDILRSARNAALNQYPRFSLDGKDAMYRSSFHHNLPPRLPLPATIAGESVVWCKPGVVAKLMGLDAVPVPVLNYNKLHNNNSSSKERLSSIMKKQSLRRIAERREMERRRRRLLQLDMNGCVASSLNRGTHHLGSCSKASANGYNCVMKRQIPVVHPVNGASAYWQTPHFM